jgi:hypothetical protein
LHIEPGHCFIAGGMWMPMPEDLKKIRQEIDYNGDDLAKLLKAKSFKKYFAAFCSGSIDKQEVIKGLIELCEHQEYKFKENILKKLKYIEGKSGDIQFILEKYLYCKGGPEKFARPTIEHIVPQDDTDPVFKKFKLGNKETYRLIHQIGNLTVIERSENSDKNLFNQNLHLKFPLYKRHQAKMNKIIYKYAFLSDPESSIAKRGENISGQVFDLFMDTLKTGKWK